MIAQRLLPWLIALVPAMACGPLPLGRVDGGNGSSQTCSPACAAGQVCVDRQCVDQCQVEACAPASTCTQGSCVAVTLNSLGGPCGSASTPGAGSAAGTTCLVPYEAALTGVWTKVCSDTSACARGQVCTTFPSDPFIDDGAGIGLCADPSLRPCQRDADCALTPGFVCMVGFVDTATGPVSAQFCAPAQASGLTDGSSCSFTPGNGCASGLCILAGGANSGSRFCTSPCKTSSDCSFPGISSTLTCQPVTIFEEAQTLATRSNLCIIGDKSIGDSCTLGSGANCNADAPYCMASVTLGRDACAPNCTDNDAADCTDGLQCNEQTQICD